LALSSCGSLWLWLDHKIGEKNPAAFQPSMIYMNLTYGNFLLLYKAYIKKFEGKQGCNKQVIGEGCANKVCCNRSIPNFYNPKFSHMYSMV
jgi:hypothetical protein